MYRTGSPTLHADNDRGGVIDGDPDPISAGTAGDAALWGGSSAAVGMAANPFGAHQAGRHRAGRVIGRCWVDHDRSGGCRA
jgi:hypothetical protein